MISGLSPTAATSTTYSSASEKDSTTYRTSSTAWIPTSKLGDLAGRLARIVGLPESHAESFQVGVYEAGAEYKLHVDTLPDFNGKEGGGRCYTFILYLERPEEGGRTVFPEIGVEVEPEVGTLLLFKNIVGGVERGKEFDMETDWSMQHKGEKVSRGRKVILTSWWHPVPLPTK